MNRRLHQTGDTIVEVMLSIAIVALAITISYSISVKNLNVGISARERTQAVGLVQGQIERMAQTQQISSASLNNLNAANKHFCFNVNSTDNTPQINGTVDPNNNDLLGDNTAYNGNCVSGSKYYLDINYVPKSADGSSGNSFMFSARWYRAGGGADQVVTIYYRPW